MGAVPGAFEGGELTLDACQEFCRGGAGEQGGGETGAGVLGEDGAEEVGLDPLEPAFLPVGADQGIDVEAFGGGFGRRLRS